MVEIVLIVLAIMFGIVLLWLIRHQCRKHVRNWFRKEAEVIGLAPAIKGINVQQPTSTRATDVY